MAGLAMRQPDNSSWELSAGTHFLRKHVRKDVAQGPPSGLAALPPRRGLSGVGRENTDYLVAQRPNRIRIIFFADR